MSSFHVISGTTARQIIAESRVDVIRLVRDAYVTHHEGNSINPNSYFLRFPEKGNSRIIALPAYLGGKHCVAGLKWISSFPGNITRNVPRASAVLLLNDFQTGYPFACLEASQISAARTAASAVIGAEKLAGRRKVDKIAVVGAGIIARNIFEFFIAQDWTVGQFAIYDKVVSYSESFERHIKQIGWRSTHAKTLSAAVDGADIVVFATTADRPYVTDLDTFQNGQVVLNISLRDLGPNIIANSYNILDDVEHCLTANTSPHLAEQRYRSRDFINGTLAGLMCGDFELDNDKPKIFSPFGLGILDLAVGVHVYRKAMERQVALEIPNFFGEIARW